MENDTRIIKAVAYLDNALYQLDINPIRSGNLKFARTAIRTAQTLLRNTKTDIRMHNLEKEIELVKELVLKKNIEK